MMRALVALVFLLAACAAAEPTPSPEAPAPTVPAVAPAPTPSPAPTTLTLSCAGALTQGGVVLCRTLPGADIFVDGAAAGAADANGWAVVGFNRDHGSEGRVEARHGGASAVAAIAIAAREYDVQRVNGLPQQTVTPTDPAVLARIQRETALKQTGFASLAAMEGFLDGFVLPVDGTITGRWGNQRILNGTPSTPHFGVDIAAPEGTPIRAPAAGVVSFANADMHYEGGLVFIDHGQGLITMYLHMSRLDVVEGQRVAQGDVIGAVGARGRATGPHLCWRMRWRGHQLDPSLALEGLTAARTQLASAQ